MTASTERVQQVGRDAAPYSRTSYAGLKTPTYIDRVALAAAVEALTIAQERIQAECGMCDGHGFTIETATGSTAEHHPSCDGNCTSLCPIEVETQEQVQEPCEYCGRPIGVIALLAGELAVSPEQESSSPSDARVESSERRRIGPVDPTQRLRSAGRKPQPASFVRLST